ncbi:MAG: circadian clock KaiB family protein [Thermodesulfobacteriota bacterium]
MKKSLEPAADGDQFVFQLFVAGGEFHSKEAKVNLTELCESHLKGHYTIQIIDVFESYTIALENGIFLTPALIKVSPRPRRTIFGNLSDTEEVLTALELTGGE